MCNPIAEWRNRQTGPKFSLEAGYTLPFIMLGFEGDLAQHMQYSATPCQFDPTAVRRNISHIMRRITQNFATQSANAQTHASTTNHYDCRGSASNYRTLQSLALR